ncbi:hypothetical protein C4J98_2750 [Pseudomonas orientalis]|nr:hypothetical protein C4J98_2750 [Pseudomonas orientalis]
MFPATAAAGRYLPDSLVAFMVRTLLDPGGVGKGHLFHRKLSGSFLWILPSQEVFSRGQVRENKVSSEK